MNQGNETLSVAVTINAEPEAVWAFLSEQEKLLSWMTFIPGSPVPAGSVFEPSAGGKVCIMFPNGGAAKGSVVAVEPLHRVVFTWGYEPDVGKTGLRPGASRVEIAIAREADGTRATLKHSGSMSSAVAKQHVPGWRHMLSQLALQSAMMQTQRVLADVLSGYFSAWNEPDEAKRGQVLRACCDEGVRVRTQFACTDGIDALSEHIANGLKKMPGCLLGQGGMAQHIHGVARVPWIVRSAEGKKMFSGENIITLSAAGKIERVVGFAG